MRAARVVTGAIIMSLVWALVPTVSVAEEPPSEGYVEGWVGTVVYDLTRPNGKNEKYTVTLTPDLFIDAFAVPEIDDPTSVGRAWRQGYRVDYTSRHDFDKVEIETGPGTSICFDSGWEEAVGSAVVTNPEAQYPIHPADISIGWGPLRESGYGEQRLWFQMDLRPVVTTRTHLNGDCGGAPSDTETTGEFQVKGDLISGLSSVGGLNMDLSDLGAPESWPKPPGQPVTMNGTKTFYSDSIVPGSDPTEFERDTTVVTWNLELVVGTDQDEDGVPDSADQCPTVPGVPSNGGCPLEEEEECDAKYSFGQLKAAMDGDIAQTDYQVRWCTTGGEVRLRGAADTYRAILDPTIVTVALESILGIEFKLSGEEPSAVETATPDGLRIVLDAGGFDACVSALDFVLLAVPFGKLTKLTESSRFIRATPAERDELLRTTILKRTGKIERLAERISPDFAAGASDLYAFAVDKVVGAIIAGGLDSVDDATEVCVSTWDPEIQVDLRKDGTAAMSWVGNSGIVISDYESIEFSTTG